MLYLGIFEFGLSDLASDTVYFIYIVAFSNLIACMAGTVSLLASWFFVHGLYATSKSD